MRVEELNKKQLLHLKREYLEDKAFINKRRLTQAELDNADNLVSDEKIMEFYRNYVLSPSDTW